MFGIGMTEIIIILVVALVVIGPDKLPAMMKSVGKAFGEFKAVARDLKDSVSEVEADLTIEGIEIEPPSDGDDEKPRTGVAPKAGGDKKPAKEKQPAGSTDKKV